VAENRRGLRRFCERAVRRYAEGKSVSVRFVLFFPVSFPYDGIC
jgi:hypothetical protein